MKCPACETDVPYGLSVCAKCGMPLPSAGGLPEAGPGAGPANPKTEPLSIPDWDAEEKPSWEGSVDRYGLGSPVTDDPGPSIRDRGAPSAHPRPLEYPVAPNDSPSASNDFRSRWGFGSSAGPESIPNLGAPAEADSAPNFGAPLPPASDATQNLGAPGGPAPSFGAPLPPATDATQNFGAPSFGGPAPAADATQNLGGSSFGGARPATDATQNLGGPSFGGPPPAADATQNLGGPGPTPGYEPPGWDPNLPPGAGPTAPAGGDKDRNRKIILLAGGIAAVVLLGGAVWVLASGSSDKAPSAGSKPDKSGAAQQAAAVNEILKTGKTARGHLPTRLRTCDDVSEGVSGFEQVVRDRQQELNRSKNLKVDGLKDGSRLRQSMIAAYQSSLRADQAYLAWAREIQGRGCGGKIAPLTGHYKDAISANDKAGPAKRQVVSLWKPIADTHGLPTYIWNRL
jgi:hypothetical protein